MRPLHDQLRHKCGEDAAKRYQPSISAGKSQCPVQSIFLSALAFFVKQCAGVVLALWVPASPWPSTGWSRTPGSPCDSPSRNWPSFPNDGPHAHRWRPASGPCRQHSTVNKAPHCSSHVSSDCLVVLSPRGKRYRGTAFFSMLLQFSSLNLLRASGSLCKSKGFAWQMLNWALEFTFLHSGPLIGWSRASWMQPPKTLMRWHLLPLG